MPRGIGFNGAVDEAAFGILAPTFGALYGVVEPTAWKATPVAGDRMIQVAAGTGFCGGAAWITDAAESKQFEAASTGTRWDLLVRTFDWSPPTGGTAALDIIKGGSTETVPPLRNRTPGVKFDVPLALVPVTAGGTALGTPRDLRVWAAKVLTAGVVSALPVDAPLGTEAVVGSVRYRRGLSSTGQPVWQVQRSTRLVRIYGSGGTRHKASVSYADMALSRPPSSLQVTLSAGPSFIGDSTARATAYVEAVTAASANVWVVSDVPVSANNFYGAFLTVEA